MDKIKFGVWGFGRMGKLHTKFYVKEPNLQFVAACDVNKASLKVAADEYGARTYSDETSFINDSEMDLIVIVTLSLDHTKHAIRALETGKYVLLDKPIAITDDELALLREADKKYPGKLFILHNLRFEPGFEQIQETVKRGILGEISMIKIRRHHRNWYYRADWQTLLEYGGGLLNNWGNHDIDHAVQLMGSHAADVWSQLWQVSSGGNGDDHVKILLKGNNGRVADIEISNNVTKPEPYCTIHGQKGTLVCNHEMREIQVRYLDPDFNEPNLTIDKNPSAYNNIMDHEIPWLEETIQVEDRGNMWEYIDRKIIRYVYEQIKNGRSSPIKNSDAFETVRIIQEVKKQNPQFNWIK